MPDADVVAGAGEGGPGNVEPAVAGEQLVGVGVCPQERHEEVELCRVARTDVGCLTGEVLRILETSDPPVHLLVPIPGVDDDGSDVQPGRFQQLKASVGQVGYILLGGDVPWIFTQIEELAQAEVSGELHVFEASVVHDFRCFSFTLQSYEKILTFASISSIYFVKYEVVFGEDKISNNVHAEAKVPDVN